MVEAPAASGQRARLCAGSIVYLTGADSNFDGEPCELLKREEEEEVEGSCQWQVRPLHPRFSGYALRVPEQNLVFGYCMLPGHASAEAALPKGVAHEEAQGGRGRGLVATRRFAKGDIIFEEQPFLVAADDTNEMCRAFFMMRSKAASEPTMKQALAAFDGLSPGSPSGAARQKCRAAAERAAEAAMGGEDAIKTNPEQWKSEVTALTDALLRWEMNRFRLPLGAGAGDGAHALYGLISRLNHACCPTATSSWEPSEDACGGRSVVRAARDVAPGDALCLSYGPPELTEWKMAKRKAYLVRQNGFVCQCPRCLEEGEKR